MPHLYLELSPCRCRLESRPVSVLSMRLAAGGLNVGSARA